MKVGVDTNVLVEAHVPGCSRHREAREYLLQQLRVSDVTLILTTLVLQEFVHVITDSRRFASSPPMAEALAMAAGYLSRDNVECLPVEAESLRFAFELLDRHRLGRNRIADTVLAATLLTHGVHRLATFNSRDFALFEPLRAFEPAAQT
jgi:toxin-antitoxin system PIN domain toxin